MPNRLAISPRSAKYKAFRILAGLERVLRRHRPTTPQQLASIRNFLFLQYDAPLGSAVHATPLFESIKTALPEAHITVAASRMMASVVQHNPSVDCCVVTPSPRKNFLGALRAVRNLYRQLPTGAVCIATTTGNQRPILALLSLLTGRATRMGYTLALPLYDVALDFRADRPQIENNLDILRALGREALAPEPRVFFSREEVAYATHLFSGLTSETPRIAVVTQCSDLQPKQWSEGHFRSVIAALHSTRSAIPIFLGTKEESAAIEVLRQPLAERGISLAGKTPAIPQLAAVLAQCDFVLSLDTGIFHVARAVGLPGVVIAPAWQNPAEWLPVGHSQYRILRGDSIPMPTLDYWMEEIGVEPALQAMLALMDAFPSSEAARYARLKRSLSNPAHMASAIANEKRDFDAAHRQA